MSETRKLAIESNLDQQIEERTLSRPMTPTELQEQEFVAELLSSTGYTKDGPVVHEEPMIPISMKDTDYSLEDVIDDEEPDKKKKKKKKSKAGTPTKSVKKEKKKDKLTVRPNISTIVKPTQSEKSPTESKNIKSQFPSPAQNLLAKSLPAEALSPHSANSNKKTTPRKSFDVGQEKPNSPLFDSKFTPKSTERSQKSTFSGSSGLSSTIQSIRLSGMKMKKKWMTPSPNFVSKTPRFTAFDNPDKERERTPSPAQYNVSTSTFVDTPHNPKVESHLGSATFRSTEKRFFNKINEEQERAPSPHTYDPLKSEESIRAHSGVIASSIFKMSPRRDLKTTSDETPSFTKYYPAKVEAIDKLSPRVSSPLFSKETSPRFAPIKPQSPALTKYSPEKALPGITIKEPDKNMAVFKSASTRLATYATIEKNKTPDTSLPIDLDIDEILSMGPTKK